MILWGFVLKNITHTQWLSSKILLRHGIVVILKDITDVIARSQDYPTCLLHASQIVLDNILIHYIIALSWPVKSMFLRPVSFVEKSGSCLILGASPLFENHFWDPFPFQISAKLHKSLLSRSFLPSPHFAQFSVVDGNSHLKQMLIRKWQQQKLHI